MSAPHPFEIDLLRAQLEESKGRERSWKLLSEVNHDKVKRLEKQLAELKERMHDIWGGE